jgi:hypothetical protein
MKKILCLPFFFVFLLSCTGNRVEQATRDTAVSTPVDTMLVRSTPTEKTVIKDQGPDAAHQYWMVDNEARVYSLLKLTSDNSYTHVVQGPDNFKMSGSGDWLVSGSKIRFTRTRGVCFDGEADFKLNDDGRLWIILPNGGKIYVQDDEGYYIKNSIATPVSKSAASNLPYDKRIADEYDRKHSCSDQDAFDLGYSLARDQIGNGLMADADYLYQLTDGTSNYYCFSRGVEQYIKDKR